jgi:hypothetical protein
MEFSGTALALTWRYNPECCRLLVIIPFRNSKVPFMEQKGVHLLQKYVIINNNNNNNNNASTNNLITVNLKLLE